MTQLTDFNPLRIVQSSHQPTATTWDSLDHLLIVLPEAPTSDAFRKLPQGGRLERVLDRARAAGVDYPTSRLNNSRATGITLATRTDGTAFGGLTWARKCIARCLAERPGQLGIVIAGFDNQAREKLVGDLAAAALAAAFELPRFKSEKPGARKLRRVRFLASGPRVDLSSIQAQALGNNIARWFTALPPNELDAATYPRLMEALCETHGIAVEILDESRLAKLGAHAFLAVSQGNRNRDAGIVRLRYRPTGAGRAELMLVGKGILFDTGGTNLKPFKSMLDMHIDMQGSAVALGTLIALATLQVPYSVDAWLAVTENRISATAYKPQDVIRAANGKTIQVIHTDAEGRMVLADTLALAAREEPQLMIDYATLTGACVGALTQRYSGVFSNRSAANEILREAGARSGERVWPFPMDEDYDEMLRSDVADIKQCSTSGYGDHILAARFLSKFVPDEVPWIHVDLSAGQHKGGLAHVPTGITGFGVKLTLELLGRRTPAELAAALS